MLDEELTAKAMEVIERNTRQQSSLIEDLLDVSRIISGKMRIEPQLVDVVAVAREATETFRPSALNKNLSLEFAADAPSLLVNGDPLRLQQVVANLVQNAIKFTPEKGSVSVALMRVGKNLEISVRDTGIGIGKEFLPYIFDRFRQADASARRSYSGLGLGLTIVSTIVELHGGTITVDSDGENTGTEFKIRLPLAEEFYKGEDSSSETVAGEAQDAAGEVATLIAKDDAESVAG
jgi:signal transduction histidine kinase